jgi:hypothetical protein
MPKVTNKSRLLSVFFVTASASIFGVSSFYYLINEEGTDFTSFLTTASTTISSTNLPQAFSQAEEEQQQQIQQQQPLRPSGNVSMQEASIPIGGINIVSLVDGVTVKALDISSSNQLLITLNYDTSTKNNSTANTTSGMSSSSSTTTTTMTTTATPQTPGVVLLASAVNLTSGQITSPIVALITSISNGTFSPEQIGSLVEPINNMTGTEVLNEGWNSPQTVPIPMQGDMTLDEATFINVQLLSLSE